MGLIRLQKILAGVGLASRREAERWIAAGRLKVNGRVVTAPGVRADPEKDRILLDGRPIASPAQATKALKTKASYLFYKPKNVMVTRHDPQGRPTIYDYLTQIPERVFPVGRLDFDSEGLILLTNDGDLANRLMHPRAKVAKVYRVWVDRPPRPEEIERLKKGIELEEGMARMVEVKSKREEGTGACLEVTLTQGKRRQIRRMMETIGRRVTRLRRMTIGAYSLGSLRPGEWKRVDDKTG